LTVLMPEVCYAGEAVFCGVGNKGLFSAVINTPVKTRS
jgi:hypothetical protein